MIWKVDTSERLGAKLPPWVQEATLLMGTSAAAGESRREGEERPREAAIPPAGRGEAGPEETRSS